MITLTGSQTITIERYAEYVDQGATTDDAAETTLTSSSTVNTDVVGTYSVVYTATDGHNNTSTATRTVIVEDTTAPVITITGSQTITIERYAEYVDQGATTDDAAETTLTSSSTVNTDVVGTYSVVYTATDGHNNTSTATRTVIVEDTTAPVITITGSQTITIERYAEYVDQGATTDDAAETTLTSSSTVNTDVVGTYSVVYTATDGHNNTSTATRTVIVEDTTAPVITITGSQTITIERYAEYVDQGATTDDAAETTLTSSSTVNTDVVGTYSVVYSATDGHNNTSTATRTVIVEDTTAPVITITGSQTITIERYAEYVDQGATTDDAAETTLTSSSTVNTDVVGTYSVVYTATDGHNNTSTATRTVIVEDTTAPVITITGSQTITIERYAEYVDQGATTDDAAETTLTSSSTVNTDVVGTYSVVYTATDGHNNTSTATRTVIVEDTTAPVITITGSQTITIERYAEYVDQGATTDDAAETTLTSSSTVNTDVVGTYSVVYTATDGHNNTSTATRTVFVEDTTAPVITITGSQTITIERYAEYVDQGATTDDAAETTLTSSSTVNTDVVGTYSVVYTATDGHNNTSTATRTVIVEDTTAPVITITGSQTITIERYAEYVDQGATTDDAAETTLTSSSTVNTDVVGTYSVVYTATDGHNNTSTATRTVIVEDTTAPVITITGSQTITIERYAEYVDQGATTDDAAETTLTSSSTVNTDVVGTYSVVYTATDGHNNTSTATRTVIVEDTTAPVITISTSKTIIVEEGIINLLEVNVDEPVTFDVAGEDSEYIELIIAESNISAIVKLISPSDYETKIDYNFDIIVTDVNGLTSSISIEVNVNDDDEIPPVITGNTSITILEESTIEIGKYTTNEVSQFLIVGADAEFITLTTPPSGLEAIIELIQPADFESKPTYNFALKAIDSNGNSSTLDILINVTDLDERKPRVTEIIYSDDLISNNEILLINLTMSKNVRDFGIEDLISGEGEFNNLIGSQSDFAVEFVPVENYEGYAKIEIPENSFSDNSRKYFNDKFVDSIMVDTKSPEMFLEIPRDTVGYNQLLPFKINFSEEISSFNESQINVSIGEIRSLTKLDEFSYSAIFYPPEEGIFQEDVIISIAENTVTDLYGNINTSPQSVTFHLDNTIGLSEPEFVDGSEGNPISNSVYGADFAGTDGFSFSANQPFIGNGNRDTDDPGTLIFNSDGSYTYTPNEHFYGEIIFEYFITNEEGQVFGPFQLIIVVEENPDDDGIPTALEELYPSNDIDGDGIPDRKADHIASFPMTNFEDFNSSLDWANDPNRDYENAPSSSSMGSIIVGTPNSDGLYDADNSVKLSDISIEVKPDQDPYESESAVIQDPLKFSLNSADGIFNDLDNDPSNGVQVRLTIDLPSPVKASTYLKSINGEVFEYLDDQDLETFDEGATLIDANNDGFVERVVLTITDNGVGDTNPISGVIDDPGSLGLYKPDVKNFDFEIEAENTNHSSDLILHDFFDIKTGEDFDVDNQKISYFISDLNEDLSKKSFKIEEETGKVTVINEEIFDFEKHQLNGVAKFELIIEAVDTDLNVDLAKLKLSLNK